MPVWALTVRFCRLAHTGVANPTVTAHVAATIASRARVAAKPEKNLLVVSTLFSLAHYWQLFGSGGSTRTYVIGPVKFTPHEVIW